MLSQNKIEKLESLANIKGNDSLTELDISDNPVTSHSEYRKTMFEWYFKAYI